MHTMRELILTALFLGAWAGFTLGMLVTAHFIVGLVMLAIFLFAVLAAVVAKTD